MKTQVGCDGDVVIRNRPGFEKLSFFFPILQAKRLFDKHQPTIGEVLALDQCHPSLTYKDMCAHNGQPYTEQQMDSLKHCMKEVDNLGTFFVDFMDILSLGASRGRYIPTDCLESLILASLKWQQEDRLRSLYFFLQQDLGLRPLGNLGKSMLSQLLEACISSLKAIVSERAGSSSSSSSECHPCPTACLLLTQFITMALLQSLGDPIECHLPLILRVLKHQTLVKLIDVTFLVTNSRLCQDFTVLSAIQQQLLVLLCLPLATSQHHGMVNHISQEFANHLLRIQSSESKRNLLLQIPSEFLRENLLERLLEVEFSLHPSASHFEKTSSMQNNPMSLSKFCCVHLCRVPYHPSLGEPGNVAYFLSLLCYLLQSHILRLTGSLPVTLPGLEYTVPQRTCNSDELQASLASVKPHIAGLVDRISEDGRLLTSLVQPECWMYLQLLGNLTELVVC